MFIDGEYRKIGMLDVTELKKLVNDITPQQWSEHGERQKTYDVHQSTQSIPLIFDADLRHRFPTTHSALNQFKPNLIPALQTIVDFFEDKTPDLKRKNQSYFIRIILVKLAANSEITEHTDNGYSLCRSHRIHLPIVSNSEVEFKINGATKAMKEGELWEINNRYLHGVSNRSDSPRVHFILDYVVRGEKIIEPNDEQLIA